MADEPEAKQNGSSAPSDPVQPMLSGQFLTDHDLHVPVLMERLESMSSEDVALFDIVHVHRPASFEQYRHKALREHCRLLTQARHKAAALLCMYNLCRRAEQYVGGFSTSEDQLGLTSRFKLLSFTSTFSTPKLSIFGSRSNDATCSPEAAKEKRKEEREQSMALRIERRGTSRLSDAISEGVPPAVRGRLWRCAVANELNVTTDLYLILRGKARAKTELKTPKARHEPGVDEQLPGADVDDTTASCEAASCQLEKKRSFLAGHESTTAMIGMDLTRTFPALDFFKPGGPYHDTLRAVLEAYACFRPDIGYVQGMSYLVAMLLLNVNEEDAFVCFANLVHRPLLLSYYRMDLATITPYLSLFDHFLRHFMSDVHAHFAQLGLTSDMYMVDWILTVLCKSAPMDVAVRIWDAYFVYGDYFLYRMALGVIKMYRAQLLGFDFETAAAFLTNLPHDMDFDVLLRTTHSITISQNKFNNQLAKFSALKL